MNMKLKKAIKRLMIDVLHHKKQFFIISLVLLTILCFCYLSEVFESKSSKNEYFYCGESIDVVYTWVNGSDPVFRRNLQKYLENSDHMAKDFSEARYDDKYELKYSLRSLEKYAKWVRHVYIVTNGQIPYWLNVDYERVTLVTHEEIFEGSEDLPTFSSPAIERHIHRIPGISKRFIYFNDDMFLNSPIYPEDFYSPNLGFLVYLSWAMPACAPDCPWSYVGDEQCDRSCLNKDCQFDGGDCNETKKKRPSVERHDDYDESEETVKDTDDDYYELNEIKPNEIPKINNTKFEHKIRPNRTELTIVKPLNISHIVDQHNKKIIQDNHLRRKKNRLLIRHKYFKERFANITNNATHNGYEIHNGHKPKSFDSFALSLQHSNRVFNRAYGFVARKVPAHAPIMIDKDVMEEMQMKFGREFEKTRMNRLRSADDMQFSFSYYYFLISETVNKSVAEIFDDFDTDDSGTWSDREIRTILTRLNNLPLTYNMVDLFDQIIINCSKNTNVINVSTPPYERYIDSKLPTITKEMVVKCVQMSKILEDHFGTIAKYKYEIMKNSHGKQVMFKMLTSNITNVVWHLDEIRRTPRKFICLNDDINPTKIQENEIVRDILLDFYMSLFPKPSRFELPEEYRNRFGYVSELAEWKAYHSKAKVLIFLCIICMFGFSFNGAIKRRLPRRIKKYIYL